MLSRLKRKPTAPPPAHPAPLDPEGDADAPPDAASSPSSPTSTRSSRDTTGRRSMTTPVKSHRFPSVYPDSLSPTRHRAYTASPPDPRSDRDRDRPASRASSFGSFNHDRPSTASTHAIGQGSLSLHHLAPPDGHPHHPQGLTLVVQAPELLVDSAATHDDVFDHHGYGHDVGVDSIDTPTDTKRVSLVAAAADQRTPLAEHEPLFDPPPPATTSNDSYHPSSSAVAAAATLGHSTHSSPGAAASLSPDRAIAPASYARTPTGRPRSHTSSEVVRSALPAASPSAHARGPRASENGLAALEAINRGPDPPALSSAAGAAARFGGAGNGMTVSPPSMSRGSSSRGRTPAGTGAGPGAGAHSRPLSRSSSITSQRPPSSHAPAPAPASAHAHALAPSSSYSLPLPATRSSYSPARARKPSPSVSAGSAVGGAGALVLGGVALAGHGAGAGAGAGVGLGAAEGAERGAAASPVLGGGTTGAGAAGGAVGAGAPPPATPPTASARTSLESHIASSGGAGAGAGGGGAYFDESDTQSVYPDHHSHAGAFLSMDHLGDYDDVVSQLGTGYAVASSKRNADFHALFKNVPDDDYLIEDYGCALQREILIQGRLYISEHHLSFYANIFGWVTSLVIPFSEVCSIEKRMTAYVIPNAIQVATMHARHTFASFLSRDTTYDLIGNIWRMVHPVIPLSAALPDALSTSTSRTGGVGGVGEHHVHLQEPSDDEGSGGSPGVAPATAAVVSGSGVEVAQSSEGVGSRAKRRLKGLRRPRGATGESAPGGKGLGEGGGGAGGRGGDARASVEGGGGSGGGENGGAGNGVGEGADGPGGKKKKKGGGGATTPPHAPTVDTCPTLKGLKEVCMDAQFPGAPEKIYNLMFTSGFMKGFWSENQKLTEIQIGDWAPQASGSNLLARSMSYIKPLNGSIGPRQTKCLITDESAHVDFDDFVCVVTTTRTPDVPSGSAFAVKTRTSMTWARGNHCRVVVTTGVEWTKSSFIKGIIEKSAIDGQKQYHADLEKAMRAYISTHRNEFVEEGHDDDESDLDSVDGAAATAAATAEDGVDASVAAELASARAKTGLLAPLWSALEPFFEHLAHQTPQSLLLGAVVAILVLSNLWTLRSGASYDVHPAERARRRAAGEVGPLAPAAAVGGAAPLAVEHQPHPHDVANAVRDVLHHYFAAQHHPGGSVAAPAAAPVVTATPVAGEGAPASDPGHEDAHGHGHGHVGLLARELDALEARVRALKAQLSGMGHPHPAAPAGEE